MLAPLVINQIFNLSILFINCALALNQHSIAFGFQVAQYEFRLSLIHVQT